MLNNFSKEYLNNLQPNSLLYSYKGAINHSKTTKILNALKNLFPDNYMLTKKVYTVSNELLENTIFHSNVVDENIEFIIVNQHNSIRVISINYSNIDEYNKLINKAENLNQLNESEVKETYLKKLLDNSINNKGTIGVGLNLIKLRTNNKLVISYEKINHDKCIILIDITINV